jgi:hypothetical protein
MEHQGCSAMKTARLMVLKKGNVNQNEEIGFAGCDVRVDQPCRRSAGDEAR